MQNETHQNTDQYESNLDRNAPLLKSGNVYNDYKYGVSFNCGPSALAPTEISGGVTYGTEPGNQINGASNQLKAFASLFPQEGIQSFLVGYIPTSPNVLDRDVSKSTTSINVKFTSDSYAGGVLVSVTAK